MIGFCGEPALRGICARIASQKRPRCSGTIRHDMVDLKIRQRMASNCMSSRGCTRTDLRHTFVERIQGGFHMEYLFHEHIRCSWQIGVVARKPLIHSIAECSDPVPACTRGSQSSTTNVLEMIL